MLPAFEGTFTSHARTSTTMLPRKLLATRWRYLWIALLALSPLAYLASVGFSLKYDPNSNAGLATDRAAAIQSAARFAESKGVPVAGWTPLCQLKSDDDLRFYYQRVPNGEGALARWLAPEVKPGVRFRSPDKSQNIEVELDRTGRPLGFSHRLAGTVESPDPGEAAARTLAEAALAARFATLREAGAAVGAAPSGAELKLTETSSDGIVFRRFTWQWPLQSLEGLTLRSVLTVRGNRLTHDLVEAEVSRQYARQHLGARSRLRLASSILFGLVTFITVIFGLYRFVQRLKQKEISFQRVAVLAGLFTVASGLTVVLTDVAIYDTAAQPGVPIPDWGIALIGLAGNAVLGLFIGLAYGSGEGDIRESYPGKLTSLDALLTGRFFSRNATQSVLWGCALGGWMALASSLTFLPWQGRPGMGEEMGPIFMWLGRAVWISSFQTWPLDVMLVVVIGLLLPLPFLRRRFRSHRVILPLLAAFLWIACSGPYLGFRPWTATLLMGAVRAAVVLLAFFYFDLLTTIVALAMPTFFWFAVSLTAQPAASLRESGFITLGIAAAGLLGAIIFVFKGRTYREDEVRPLYARLLAERLSMKAEVSAAREAQLRLMPESLPKTPYFEIAAACEPAHEVGGDFYDLFELEPGRLGVLVAEGGGKGLGSALSIAFAKGFLTPRISNPNADDSPTELIRGIQDRLMTMLDEGADVGLTYAVLDATDRSLWYARIGSHPAVLVANGDVPAKPKEIEKRFNSTRGGADPIVVTEGRIALEPGSNIIFYTDGIAKDWRLGGTAATTEFDKILNKAARSEQAGQPGSLQEALSKSVTDRAKQARRRGAGDDLTAVIVKLQ
jgi:serine phosphatase RsbU (regulator of sigma subunit)